MKAATDSRLPSHAHLSLTCSRQTASPQKCTAYHTHVEINLVKRGTVTYLAKGEELSASAGRLVAYWAAIPHQIVGATADAEYYVMTVPLVWLLQWQLPENFTHQILNGQILIGEREDSQADLENFARWTEDLACLPQSNQRMVLLEVEARLLRMALALHARTPKPQALNIQERCKADNVDRIRKMMSYIAQNYTERITVELISESVGLHPNYAMTVFRKTFGTTLIDFVTLQRVAHAQRLLAVSNRKIVDVAFSSGFNSVSRFNDAFKRECGCSPREYRLRCSAIGLN